MRLSSCLEMIVADDGGRRPDRPCRRSRSAATGLDHRDDALMSHRASRGSTTSIRPVASSTCAAVAQPRVDPHARQSRSCAGRSRHRESSRSWSCRPPHRRAGSCRRRGLRWGQHVPLVPCALAASAPHRFAHRRQVDDAAVLESDQHSVQRDAVGKRHRAVDRVRTHRQPVVPGISPCSSPSRPSSGNVRSMMSRPRVSAARSASVTMVPSALVSVCNPSRPKKSSVISPMVRASPTAAPRRVSSPSSMRAW